MLLRTAADDVSWTVPLYASTCMGNTPVIGPHRPRSVERFDTSCNRTDGVCRKSLRIRV